MMALIMHCRKAYKISPLLHWVKIQLRVYPALVNNYHKFIYVEWWGPCCSLFWIFYVVFCARWCLFLWIVHSWLSFPFSLTFIFYWKYAAAMYVYSIQIITRNNTCIYAFILYNINTISFFYILLKWYVDWLQPSSPPLSFRYSIFMGSMLIPFEMSQWAFSYCSLIFNYRCNQCLSPLTLWVQFALMARSIDTTLC